MGKISDMLEQRYGRLVVKERLDNSQSGMPRVLCACDCGKEHETSVASIRNGHTRSCGCLRKELLTSHGKHKSSEYESWHGMIQRCASESRRGHANYGGRGITVCARWLLFEHVHADMGDKPSPKHSLDRRDNNGPYSKDNCRWATRSEQQNNRRNTVFLTVDGVTKALTDWARQLGVSRHFLAHRKRAGWSDVEIITTPPGTARKQNATQPQGVREGDEP